MDNFLIIGSEDVKCQYASLEQINSKELKKKTQVLEKHQNVEGIRASELGELGLTLCVFPLRNRATCLVTLSHSSYTVFLL